MRHCRAHDNLVDDRRSALGVGEHPFLKALVRREHVDAEWVRACTNKRDRITYVLHSDHGQHRSENLP